MRKKVFGRQLSRSRKARIALFRSQIRALVLVGKIKTTKAKAKAIQGTIDKLIRLARTKKISSTRKILANLGNDRGTTEALVTKIAPAFSERTSGFTRIIPLPPRHGDAAQMARIEWVEEVVTNEKEKVETAKKKSAASDVKNKVSKVIKKGTKK